MQHNLLLPLSVKEGKSGPDKAVIRLEPGALNLGNWVGREISKSDLFCYPMMVALWRGRPPAGWGYNCFCSHVLLTRPLFGRIKGANCFHILSLPTTSARNSFLKTTGSTGLVKNKTITYEGLVIEGDDRMLSGLQKLVW